MKETSIYILSIFFTVAFVIECPAQTKFGIGGQLFSPAGFSVKAELNQKIAITGVTAFVLSDVNNELSLQANLIFKKQRPDFNIESGNLYMYYGGGLQYLISDTFSNRVWFRAPIGIEYEIAETPLGIYLDFAPSLMVEPNMILYLESSMGARFYF